MFMSRLSELMELEDCTEDLAFPALASSSIEDCTFDSLTSSSLWVSYIQYRTCNSHIEYNSHIDDRVQDL